MAFADAVIGVLGGANSIIRVPELFVVSVRIAFRKLLSRVVLWEAGVPLMECSECVRAAFNTVQLLATVLQLRNRLRVVTSLRNGFGTVV